jgi:hypothetical protein
MIKDFAIFSNQDEHMKNWSSCILNESVKTRLGCEWLLPKFL